jgi:hypothetical protein
MRTEGEHADTLWLETACSPLPRTQAYVCPIAEATLCYRTRPHSAILISTNEAYAGAAWWHQDATTCVLVPCAATQQSSAG